MMEKMGWQEGESLGVTGQDGIKEPIELKVQNNREGIGFDGNEQKQEMAIGELQDEGKEEKL
jgi:hypothetical protein